MWAGLPRRVDNQLKNCVQAAVLCVDSRKGDLLAVTGGRSALDGVDRWQTMVMPGDLFTPVVNLCAVDQRRTVIRSSPEVTGRGVGFNTVIETAQKAGYKGTFRVPRICMPAGSARLSRMPSMRCTSSATTGATCRFPPSGRWAPPRKIW